jgi:hypothetical protein
MVENLNRFLVGPRARKMAFFYKQEQKYSNLLVGNSLSPRGKPSAEGKKTFLCV